VEPSEPVEPAAEMPSVETVESAASSVTGDAPLKTEDSLCAAAAGKYMW